MSDLCSGTLSPWGVRLCKSSTEGQNLGCQDLCDSKEDVRDRHPVGQRMEHSPLLNGGMQEQSPCMLRRNR